MSCCYCLESVDGVGLKGIFGGEGGVCYDLFFVGQLGAVTKAYGTSAPLLCRSDNLYSV